MIDNPDQVIRVIARTREALPLPAMASPELLGVVRKQSPGNDVRTTATSPAWTTQATPLASDIAAYQKHRVKRLRRLGVPRGHAAEYSAR